MNKRTLRIWLLVTMTPVFAVAIIRFIPEGAVNPVPSTLTIAALDNLVYLERPKESGASYG